MTGTEKQGAGVNVTMSDTSSLLIRATERPGCRGHMWVAAGANRPKEEWLLSARH